MNSENPPQLPPPGTKNIELENIPEQAENHNIEEGLTITKSPSGLSVIVDGYGFYLSKKSERLAVKKSNGKVVWQFPLQNLSDIFIFKNGSSLSTDLIAEAAERGIALHIVDGSGHPVAQLETPNLTATIETKRIQLLALENDKARHLASSFTGGKILNQSRLLRYFSKYLTQSNSLKAEQVTKIALELVRTRKQIQEIANDDMSKFRQTLMGLEGNSAARYWEAVKLIVCEKIEFHGRYHQGASDPVNCMLNYGYGILYAQVWSAVLRAGLEPYAGFLHTDRPGKPSLVLDLTEEFRAPLVDRVVIASINLGQVAKLEDGRMTLGSRTELADKILQRLESRETFEGKLFQVRSIIQMQARRVASFLRGENKEYKSFRFKW